MYNKKYRLEKIEEFNRHNPIYENMEGSVCYLAYLNVGERGWFLCDYENDWFAVAKYPHRVHTSVIKDVQYTRGNLVIVTTQNTRFTFRVITED